VGGVLRIFKWVSLWSGSVIGFICVVVRKKKQLSFTTIRGVGRVAKKKKKGVGLGNVGVLKVLGPSPVGGGMYVKRGGGVSDKKKKAAAKKGGRKWVDGR